MNSSRWGWMNRTPWLPLDEQDPNRSSRLGLDEQDPVEGRMNRSPWMNSHRWRLEEVDDG